ncbi:alpha/beta fold hydrolase [Streptomyces boninensis]|uniref:alpha/beta fold hydrolase n=1 Tax=Streptomyces boninensis TaxID=2039455 RepID=UPI003B21F1AF
MTAKQSGYAKVNGLEMYYEVHGRARAGDQRPLVLLHGGVLSIDLAFSAVLPALAEDRQVIAVDMQGHGRTADIERDMSVVDFAADVVALLDELGVPQADFLGFSLGGLTSLQIAVAHPEHVSRVVLASAHYHQDGYHPGISTGETTVPLPTQAEFEEWAATYARIAPHPEHFETLIAKATAAAHATLPWTADDLRGIAAPTLLVIGDMDFVRIEHAAEMQRLIPKAHLAVLPDTTHMGVMRRTSVLLPLLGEFL